MIVACSSCPAQYSVPDAKVRGKKVRVTCKHCGAGIIVDATSEPRREELKLEALEALAPPPPGASDDAANAMHQPSDPFSVHDEPTVIGQIPAAALEAERRFSQRTVPPPRDQPAAPPPRALPHDVPEGPLDITNVASPQAKRASQASLPPPEPLPPLHPQPASLPPQPAAEVKTLLSRPDPEPMPAQPSRALYWVLATVMALFLLLVLMRTMR